MNTARLAPAVIFLILAMLAIAAAVVFWVQGEKARSELNQAQKDVSSAAAVVSNVYRTMNIFSLISAERAREKESDRQQGESDRAQLRAALEGDSCAAQPVPADAERRLREKADRIRSRAVSAPAGGAVSGNTSA